MASTSETGHAKNAANFKELISFVIGYGTVYNPSKASIKLPALQTLSANAKNVLDQLNGVFPAYKNGVAARKVAFKPLSKLTTRVMNSLIATDASQQVVDSVLTLARKIQGKKASPKKTDEISETKSISSSQMSFDSRVDNFDKLIKLLASIPEYAPNEEELKVTSLTALYEALIANNAVVIAATTPLSNARIARNTLFYTKNTGLVDTAMDTKTYIKSVFGASSPQYKQVSGIEFTVVKV